MPTKSNICASTLTIVNILLSAFTHITTEVQALRQANLHCLQVRTELRVQYSVTVKEQVTRTLSPLHLICSVKVSTLNFILKILMKSSKYTKSIIVCRLTQDTHTQVKWHTLHSRVLTRTQSKRVWINSVQVRQINGLTHTLQSTLPTSAENMSLFLSTASRAKAV